MAGFRPVFLHDWCERYALSNLGLSAPGADQLRIAVRRFEAWVGGPLALSSLTVELVAGYLRDLLAEGAAPATVNSKRRCLLTLWRAAYDAGLAPAPGRIKPAREPHRVPDSWTLAEVGRLFAYAKARQGVICGIPRGLYWHSLLLALYDSGERVGAVRACRPEDFDRAARRLRIRPESHKCCRERLCSLSPEAVEAIARVLLTSLPADRCPIWPWPFSRRHFFRSLRRLIEGAGLPTTKRGMGLTHRLRRTSGSLVEANGGDGSRHLGNTRAVFERHYLDPRVGGQGQIGYLPRPMG